MLPGALRWLGGLVMAGSVGAYLAVSTVNGDPRLASLIAFLIGTALVILGTILKSEIVVSRVPRLGSPAHQLATLYNEGDRLKSDVMAEVEATGRKASPQGEDLFGRLRKWAKRTEETVARHTPGGAYLFTRGLDPLEQLPADDWYSPAIEFLEPRLERLAELLKERQ